MKLAQRLALPATLLVLAGCTSMSERYYVSGQDGGGDYYYAPQPQYDDYDRYDYDFNFGFRYGWGSPFGYGGWYGSWWNAWPYVPPPQPHYVAAPARAPLVAEQMPSLDRPDVRGSRFPPSDEAAPTRRERAFRAEPAPREHARKQRSGDPIP